MHMMFERLSLFIKIYGYDCQPSTKHLSICLHDMACSKDEARVTYNVTVSKTSSLAGRLLRCFT